MALLLARIAARAPVAPVVVTGDFNTGEANPATQAMLKVLPRHLPGDAPGSDGGGTANQFTLGRIRGGKIDYVFVEPDGSAGPIVRTSVWSPLSLRPLPRHRSHPPAISADPVEVALHLPFIWRTLR